MLLILFFTVILSLFALMQYRLYRVLRRWLTLICTETAKIQRLRQARWVILVLNVLFFAQLAVRGTTIYSVPLIQISLIYPMGLFFAVVVFAFLVVLIFDGVRFALWMGSSFARIISGRNSLPKSQQTEPVLDNGRRRFLRLGGLSTASVIGAIPVLAAAETARDYQINRLSLSYEDLPTGLDGVTIAQVSDLHSGVYMTERNMNEIFEIVNSLDANAIMVTGDFVDSSDSQIEPLYNALRMLRAEFGIFGCLGNHDHFATAQKVSAAVEQCGITMLNNSHALLEINGERLAVIGIDDAGRGQSNFADWHKALIGVHSDLFRIALTHRPDAWDRCRELGMNLTLAGHTHGGQVGFKLGPLNLNPVYLVHRYAMGLYTEEKKHLYVNVGVGMVGVPIRMVRPEITMFTLRRSPILRST